MITLVRILERGINDKNKEIVSSITNSTFSGITMSNNTLISMKSSHFTEISKSTFSGLNGTVFSIQDSQVDLLSEVTLRENKECLNSVNSKFDLITSSTFDQWGNWEKLCGGGLRLIQSNSTISNTIFTNNSAEIGASISIEWSLENQWSNILTNNTFSNNLAVEMGGGIYYDLNRPLISNCKFENNSAKYGPDIASYPVKIVESGTLNNKISLNDVASNLEYETTLYFDLIDYDGQVLNLEDSSTIKIVADSPGTSVKGTDFAKLTEGKAEFDNLIFVGETGDSDILFKYFYNFSFIDWLQ